MDENSSKNGLQRILFLKNDQLVSKPAPKRRQRSFMGCLCCKKRKVKCDETKPVCRNCIRIGLECQWKALSKGQRDDQGTIHKTKRKISVKNNLENEIIEMRKGTLADILITHTAPIKFTFNLFSNFFPDLNVSSQDSLFYSSFMENFIPSLARLHKCEILTPESVLIPASVTSPLLVIIFFACGASSLAFKGIIDEAIANDKYNTAINCILKEIKTPGDKKNEDSLFAAISILQTFSLRHRSLSSNATVCACHFNAAYKMLWRNMSLGLSSFRPALQIESKGFEHETRDKELIPFSTFNLSPLNKVSLRSFLFNYSVTIFFCKRDKIEKLIPNPYVFFKNIKSIDLIQDENSNQWNRENIEIPAAYAFEIAAKCTWSCRILIPLDKSHVAHHFRLLEEVVALLNNSESVKMRSSLNDAQKNSLAITRVVLRVSKIILEKILNANKLNSRNFQEDLKIIVQDMKWSRKETIFPVWCLMLGGSISLLDKDRMFFMEKLKDLRQRACSQIVHQIISYLEAIWDIHDEEGIFELIFDNKTLDSICD